MAETFNDKLEQLANKRLDDSIEAEKDTMSSGALKDYADYKKHAGIIAGMRIAKEILAKALSDCQKN